MTTAVIGLGKIGLPLAVQCASSGESVIGVDIAHTVVEAVNAGRPPFPGETGLEEGLRSALDAGLLRATPDASDAVQVSDVVIIVVPLVVDEERQPDYAAIDAATDAVASSLRPGTLVIYETTLPIGTTRHRFAKALAGGSHLELGRDLFVCHSPERVSSGTVLRDLRRYPKLVGGIDEPSGKRAIAFYDRVLQFDDRDDLPRANGVWDLGSAEAAELAKLAETTYRDINIAFANELAVVAEQTGLDIAAVIAASNSQPFSHIHTPGISVGGHCIPVYPHFLLAGAPDAVLPRVARQVNESMPGHAVGILERAVGDLRGRSVVVLGLAYRAGVREDAFSGAYDLVRVLAERGAIPSVHDPLYAPADIEARGLTSYALGEPCTAAILHTDHDVYRMLDPKALPGVEVIVDGRRALDPARWPNVTLLRIGEAVR